METRHLQRTGKTSFTVTLPKKWVEDQGLTEKDPIWFVPQASGALTILPGKNNPKPAAASLNISSLNPQWLTRELVSFYLAGTDEIVLTSDRLTVEQKNTVRQTCQWLIGLEIIDESSDKLILRNLFDSNKFPIPQSLQKMLIIGRSMLTDSITSMEIDDISLAEDVVDRDIEVDKLNFIITRQFNSLLTGKISEDSLGMSLPAVSYYSLIAIQAERIADHAVKIAQVCLNLPKASKHPLTKELSQEAKAVISLLERADKTVQNIDRAEAQKLIDDFQESQKAQKPEALPLVADSLDRIRRYILNIAEMTINFSVLKSLI